jgi:hypothetical protein
VRILADESCDFAVVRTLRSAGRDVTVVAEAVLVRRTKPSWRSRVPSPAYW